MPQSYSSVTAVEAEETQELLTGALDARAHNPWGQGVQAEPTEPGLAQRH